MHILEHEKLAVNVLASQHEALSNAFASSQLSSEQRFALAEWTTLSTGSPILKDALVSFDCEIGQIQDVGTHTILICPIVAIRKDQHPSDGALVYFNRAYHQVGEVELA